MPSSLSISLHAAAPTLRAAAAHAAVARVQHLAPSFFTAGPSATAAAAVHAAQEVIVPGLGDVDVPVEPGLYNVQLILPTGRILQDYCEVVEGETRPVVFSDDAAAGDPFSLQGLVGLDSPADVLDQLVKSRAPAPTESDPTESPSEPDPGPAAKRGKPGDLAREAPDERLDAARPVVAEATAPPKLRIGASQELRAPQCWLALGETVPPVPQSGDWRGIPADATHHCAAHWHVPGGLVPPGKRRWGVVQAHGCTELFSLPLPWRRVPTFDEAQVEVTVDPCATGRAMTSVGISDPQLEGLLSFLDRGRLGSARPIVEALDAEGLIHDVILAKLENPLAACAAAYVGLAIFDPAEQERWDGWLPNIMKHFPHIPDGAIVHARRIILRPSDPNENQEALQALKRAYAAGIPYYSVGLQLMREMLSFFTDDPEAREMQHRVAQVASRVDPGQMFTVLRFPQG